MPDHTLSSLSHGCARWLCFILLLMLPVLAGAHAVLLGSDPADGAQLDARPHALELRFNEPVRALQLRVLDGHGAPVASLAVDASAAATLRLPLPAGSDGDFAATWRVASGDDHPVAGSLSWRVGAGGGGVVLPQPAVDAGPSALLPLRLLAELALLIAAGTALALPWLRPQGGARQLGVRVVRSTAWLGLALLPLRLLAEGAALAGTNDWLAGATFTALAPTFHPLAAGLAAAGLLLLAGIGDDVHRRRPLAGAAIALASLGLSGHAAHAAGGWLAPVLVLHAAAAAIWLGALWPTAAVLRESAAADGHAALPVLGRFAHRGRELLGALAATGLLLACVQIGAPSAAWTGAYGRLLALKLGLAALAFVLGALNRWRWLPALAQGRCAAAGRLRCSVGACRVLLAGAVALSVALGTTVPPRALAVAATAQPLFERHWQSEFGPRFALDVTLRHGHPGATLSATRSDGQPVALHEVTLLLDHPQAGITALRRPLKMRADGRFGVDDLQLPLAGHWQGHAEIWIDDFTLERQTLAFDLH